MKYLRFLLLISVLPMISACQTVQLQPEILHVASHPALGPYSTAVKANGLLFMSGVIAYDPTTKTFAAPNIDAQTHLVFKNMKAILAAAGCDLEDTIKASVFLRNPSDMSRMNEIYKSYFNTHKPARTTVPGVDWGRDDVLIEIELVAKLPSS